MENYLVSVLLAASLTTATASFAQTDSSDLNKRERKVEKAQKNVENTQDAIDKKERKLEKQEKKLKKAERKKDKESKKLNKEEHRMEKAQRDSTGATSFLLLNFPLNTPFKLSSHRAVNKTC